MAQKLKNVVIMSLEEYNKLVEEQPVDKYIQQVGRGKRSSIDHKPKVGDVVYITYKDEFVVKKLTNDDLLVDGCDIKLISPKQVQELLFNNH